MKLRTSPVKPVVARRLVQVVEGTERLVRHSLAFHPVRAPMRALYSLDVLKPWLAAVSGTMTKPLPRCYCPSACGVLAESLLAMIGFLNDPRILPVICRQLPGESLLVHDAAQKVFLRAETCRELHGKRPPRARALPKTALLPVAAAALEGVFEFLACPLRFEAVDESPFLHIPRYQRLRRWCKLRLAAQPAVGMQPPPISCGLWHISETFPSAYDLTMFTYREEVFRSLMAWPDRTRRPVTAAIVVLTAALAQYVQEANALSHARRDSQ